MIVTAKDGTVVEHVTQSKPGEPYWRYDKHSIWITEAPDAPAPPPEHYRLQFSKAEERENGLNFSASGHPDTGSFIRASRQIDQWTYSGLYLPAPASLSMPVTVPKSAELSFSAGILPPEVATGARSDGATFSIEVESDDTSTEILTGSMVAEQRETYRVDMSRWSGQRVTIRIRTHPGENASLDYCFFTDPILASRQSAGRKIIMVFIDTLRPDHLSSYGYIRDTTPFLNQWSKKATVFDQARTIAPWTLPSYRAILTGAYPRQWDQRTTIQRALRQQGWKTAMISGNLYLSSNFDGHRDWGAHFAELDATATDQVDRAVEWLEASKDLDALLMLHLMDPHLPYREPPAYRRVFAGEAPEKFQKDFARSTVLRAGRLTPEEKQYIRDRYDNNLKYVDDELKRLLQTVDPDALVMIFSDHGEEFWEHGGFEHGHAMWDEIVRVPLMIRGPKVKPQRRQEFVSLLDLAPTVLQWADAELPDTEGQSLWNLLEGQETSSDQWSERATGLGHPLYGDERWGAIYQGHKYHSQSGKEWLFDLEKDPTESHSLIPASTALQTDSPRHAALARAWDLQAPVSIRFKNRGSMRHKGSELVVTATVPGGFRHGWVGEDPLQASKATVELHEDQATLRWPGGFRGTREVYLVPKIPMEEALQEITVTGTLAEQTVAEIPVKTQSGSQRRILAHQVFSGGGQMIMTLARSPVPTKNATEVSGHDDELEEMLKSIGYVTGNEPDKKQESEKKTP